MMFIVFIGCGILGLVTSHLVADRALPPLPVYGHLTTYELIDQQGARLTQAQWAGHVWIMDCMLTRCAGQCPMMSHQMQQLQQVFQRMPGVRLLSLSVDPSHDTPEALRAYAQQYGAQAQRWTFATGTPSVIDRLVREELHLGLAEGTSAAEPITHSTRLTLIDAHGQVRGYYEAADPSAVQRLIRDARRLGNTVRSS